MKASEHYIACGKFGGQRLAPACVLYDRFKVCRKSCRTLERHLEENPDILEDIKEKKNPRSIGKFSTRFAGEFLPDSDLLCKRCGFVASTPRGLQCHHTRSHKLKSGT